MPESRLTKPADWNSVAAGLMDCVNRPDLPREYVVFRSRLAEAFHRAVHVTDGASPVARVAKSDSLREVVLVENRLRELLTEIAEAVVEETAKNDIQRLLDVAGDNPEFLPDLVHRAVFHWDGPQLKALAQTTGVPLVSLLLVGRTLATPFLTEAAHATQPASEADAEQTGTCPRCDSPAQMAFLRRDDGRRELGCTVCGTFWRFPRLRCPFCDNTDRSRLAVLSVKGDEARRIEVCEECRRYVKTVDERLLPTDASLSIFIEETLTLPLDLIAEREGYVRRLY